MLNLNFDMVGSPNYVRFVYDGDNSAFPVGPGAALGPDGSGQIESVFVSYFRNQGLQSDPTPFSGRSDYGPFIAKGIPAGGLFTGAEGIKTARQATIRPTAQVRGTTRAAGCTPTTSARWPRAAPRGASTAAGPRRAAA